MERVIKEKGPVIKALQTIWWRVEVLLTRLHRTTVRWLLRLPVTRTTAYALKCGPRLKCGTREM